MEFNKQNILNKVKEAQQSTVVMDEGLRAYMLKVYNYMASGILLTGLVSLIFFKLSVVTDANGQATDGSGESASCRVQICLGFRVVPTTPRDASIAAELHEHGSRGTMGH